MLRSVLKRQPTRQACCELTSGDMLAAADLAARAKELRTAHMDRQRAVSSKNDAEMQADKLQAKMAAMPKVSPKTSLSNPQYMLSGVDQGPKYQSIRRMAILCVPDPVNAAVTTGPGQIRMTAWQCKAHQDRSTTLSRQSSPCLSGSRGLLISP